MILEETSSCGRIVSKKMTTRKEGTKKLIQVGLKGKERDN